MPKKSAPKKRTGRPVRRKKSFFESLFSFSMPKMFAVVVGAVFLTLVFQFNNTSQFVKGVSTTASLSADITDAEVAARAKNPNSVEDYPRYLHTRIWKDTNGNGKKESSESYCPEKDYKYEVITTGASPRKVSKQQKSNCGYNRIDLLKECVTIKFTSNIKNYTYSGMEYSDASGYSKKYTKSNSVHFCGGQYFEGGWSRTISFGIKPK